MEHFSNLKHKTESDPSSPVVYITVCAKILTELTDVIDVRNFFPCCLFLEL